MNTLTKFILFLGCAFHIGYCQSANVLWNTFMVEDFSSWVDGAWILCSSAPYAPGVGFLADGSVWVGGSFNADAGGSYWVHSSYGDELATIDDYLTRTMIADVNYTSDEVVAGTGVSGHEYLAIIGHTSTTYNPHSAVETYYGWVELNGNTIVSSAITSDGPLRVGTGDVIPEPTAGFLLLVGLAGLALRRNNDWRRRKMRQTCGCKRQGACRV